MPLIPLPGEDTGLAGGDLPVGEDSDVLAEFPARIKQVPIAPVRDTFVAGYGAGFRRYQKIAERAAAQSDPMRATGDYLLEYADEREVIPLPGEDEESVRARMFEAPDIVTPDAIVDGVKDLLRPYMSVEPQVFLSEIELDGWFVNDGTAAWDSFVGANPNYPDRYYPEVPSLLPGGAIPSAGLPRNFVLRIPVLDANDNNIPFVGQSYVSTADDGFYAYANPQLADELYRQVIHLVEKIKGHGISWTLIADPSLV